MLHKVKTTDALKQMGAEHYRESVLLGEVAYQVQQGFLADAHALRRAAVVSQPPPVKAQPQTGGASAPAGANPGGSTRAAQDPVEQDMLARFLLDNLQ